jgi:hypothetical protein
LGRSRADKRPERKTTDHDAHAPAIRPAASSFLTITGIKILVPQHNADEDRGTLSNGRPRYRCVTGQK